MFRYYSHSSGDESGLLGKLYSLVFFLLRRVSGGGPRSMVSLRNTLITSPAHLTGVPLARVPVYSLPLVFPEGGAVSV